MGELTFLFFPLFHMFALEKKNANRTREKNQKFTWNLTDFSLSDAFALNYIYWIWSWKYFDFASKNNTMESTNDQQTPPTISINNSSSRRKQSKPNR